MVPPRRGSFQHAEAWVGAAAGGKRPRFALLCSALHEALTAEQPLAFVPGNQGWPNSLSAPISSLLSFNAPFSLPRDLALPPWDPWSILTHCTLSRGPCPRFPDAGTPLPAPLLTLALRGKPARSFLLVILWSKFFRPGEPSTCLDLA